MIRAVIFDLDNTLCDYQTAMRNAKSQVGVLLQEAGLADLGAFWQAYQEREPGLYRQFLDRQISRDEYRIRRYADLLQGRHESPETLSAELNRVYMQEANHNVRYYDDVLPLLAELRALGIATAVLTNGPSDGQRDKFAALQLYWNVDKLFCSEEIGLSKPDPQSFRHVLNELQAEAFHTLMVGDSLETDIRGAERAGLHAVLIDRDGKHSDYAGRKARHLQEIPALLQQL